MPIALDSTSGAASSPVGSALQWTHAVVASSCILVVSVANVEQDWGAVTQIRWGNPASGSTFTRRMGTIWGSTVNHEVWTLLSPTSGSTLITVSFNNGVPNRIGIAAAFSGVDTTSPIVSTRTSTGAATSMSTEHVSGSSDFVVDAITISGTPADSSISAGSSQTEIRHSTNGYTMSMSYKTASGTSAQTSMAWTFDGSRTFGYCGLVLADQGPGGTTVSGGVLIFMQ